MWHLQWNSHGRKLSFDRCQIDADPDAYPLDNTGHRFYWFPRPSPLRGRVIVAHKRRTLEKSASVPGGRLAARARGRVAGVRGRSTGSLGPRLSRSRACMCVRNRGDMRRPRCGFTGAGRRELHQRVRRVRAVRLVVHDDSDNDEDTTREIAPRRDTASLGERRRRDRRKTVRIQLVTKTMLARDARDHGAHARGKARRTRQHRPARRNGFDGAGERARGVRRGLIWPEGPLCPLWANSPSAKGGRARFYGRPRFSLPTMHATLTGRNINFVIKEKKKMMWNVHK